MLDPWKKNDQFISIFKNNVKGNGLVAIINPQTNYFEHFRPASCGSTVTPIWGNEKFDTLMINLG